MRFNKRCRRFVMSPLNIRWGEAAGSMARINASGPRWCGRSDNPAPLWWPQSEPNPGTPCDEFLVDRK
jgi:hypothetical protein